MIEFISDIITFIFGGLILFMVEIVSLIVNIIIKFTVGVVIGVIISIPAIVIFCIAAWLLAKLFK